MDDAQPEVTPASESQAQPEIAAAVSEAQAQPETGAGPTAPESSKTEAAKTDGSRSEERKQGGGRREGQKLQGQPNQTGQQQRRDDRPPRGENRDHKPGEQRGEGNRGGSRGDSSRGDGPRGDRREGRPGGFRPDFNPEIELEKLISDSLYLDNQAHAVVARMRDMDSGTKSQLRRLYNAVRRAVRAPESERQHHFVMLRARLAYTIARHSLRSLDALERLLLQVTRRNDARGYERFKDLFEAIVAYNE